MSTKLKHLFKKHNCDKGDRHGYHRTYEGLFFTEKKKKIKILEVGCWKGESIKCWLDYFPNAEIYTIDIFTRINPKDVDVLKDPRVQCIKADTTDSALRMKMWKKWGNPEFDFIIDDGGHWPECNRLTFENLIPFLKDTGTYIIEDVWALDKIPLDKWHPWIKKQPEKYNMLEHNLLLNSIEEYSVREVDYRNTNAPDSFLYLITKK